MPIPVRAARWTRRGKHGETLGRDVLRVLGMTLRPVRGPLKLQFDHVESPLANIFRAKRSRR